MRRITSRSLSLVWRAAALTPARVRGGGDAGDFMASTRDEFGGDGWVKSGGVTSLSCGVLVKAIYAPAISVGSRYRG